MPALTAGSPMSAPTPVPPDVIVDRSGGRRAIATNHSVIREDLARRAA